MLALTIVPTQERKMGGVFSQDESDTTLIRQGVLYKNFPL